VQGLFRIVHTQAESFKEKSLEAALVLSGQPGLLKERRYLRLDAVRNNNLCRRERKEGSQGNTSLAETAWWGRKESKRPQVPVHI
jgi:hypothetical protein